MFGLGKSPLEKSLDAFLKEASKTRMWYDESSMRELDTYKRLLNLETDEQCELIQLITEQKLRQSETTTASLHLLSALMKRKLPLTKTQFGALANFMLSMNADLWVHPQAYFSGTTARYVKAGSELDATELAVIDKLYQRWMRRDKSHIKWANKLAEAAGLGPTVPPIRLRRTGAVFAETILDELPTLEQEMQDKWALLFAHAMNCSAGQPTKKWIKEGQELVSALGENQFCDAMQRWLPLIDKPAPEGRRVDDGRYAYNIDARSFTDEHLDTLKGMAWLSGLVDNDEVARAIGFAGISAYKKIPGIGPRATRVGNACVWALGNVGSESALAQLALMKVKIKFGTAQKSIAKAMGRLAERLGVTPDELEEISVPAYGLTEVGRTEEKLGEFTVVLEVEKGKAIIKYFKPDGKQQKTVPAAIKTDYAAALKELKGSAKDLTKMLSAQKERLDNMFLLQKSWSLSDWRERYLDHPVVGILARRLIWTFSSEQANTCSDAIWYDGALTSLSGTVESLPEDTTVRLWHPIGATTETIVGWRNWLFEHLIQQPFKQAHREIYLLTDAERTTRLYSNRFAAHVIKQHQFNSLCAIRGWKNRLRLMVDDEYPPASKILEQWGIRAEFWIEGVGDDYNEAYVLDSGAFRYLATDQVRFYAIDAAQVTAHAGGGGYGPAWNNTTSPDPIPMEDVPPLVLSEILRDVDLFVGVASVGNDPNWADGGPDGNHRDYWQSYSFGDLGETAQVRKTMLEALLPRLKIAKQCKLEGRFLVVKGSVRTYKIHLGSGNILMEPNDQYLCIVKAPARSKSTDVFLPFEGDGKFAMILSKAFLLAADQKITDRTILSQISLT